MGQLAISETCSRCGYCVTTCPWRILMLPADGAPRFVEQGADRCNLCGHCEAACPTGAITVVDSQLIPSRHDRVPTEVNPEHLGAYLRKRRSIRRYREETVDRSIIERMLDICRFAPTGRNRQDVQWLMVYDTREVRRLTALAVDWIREISGSGHPLAARYNLSGMIREWDEGRDYVCHNAPHLIVAHVNGENPVARTNAIIALTHLDIVAPSFGLGACWGGIFMQAVSNCEPLQEALDLPQGQTPVHCLMLGYPAIRYQRPPKRNPADIVWR